MLKAMRKNIKSLAPFLWIVIAAFIITIFAVWGGAGRLGKARGSNILIKVGKEKISVDIYNQNLRNRLEALRRDFEDLDSKLIQQLNIPQQVLDQIIQRSILLQTAQNMGIDASDEEIRSEIFSLFQRDGKFIGFDEYQRILDINRYTVSKYEESLREDIIRNKIIKVITAGITFTPEELWENYKNRNESAKMEYVILEMDKMELKEESTKEEIQKYFEKNKEKYKIPEKREATFVFFKTEDIKKEIELADSEIEKYYKDNLPQFKEPEKMKVSRIYLPYEDKGEEFIAGKAQDILEKIKSGENFGILAKKNSKDEKAEEGGDWGLFEWKSLSSVEQKEIEQLSKGDVSGAIEFEDGISILKVTEKEPPVTNSLEEVKERIKSILEDQKARELAEERIRRLERGAQKEQSLEVAAQIIGLEIRKTGLLKEREGIEDIDPSGTISTNLFQLEEREISSPIYTYMGIGIVQLKKIELPRQADLEEVKDEVKEGLLDLKKKEKALKKMKQVKAELKRRNLEDLAEKYKLEYYTADEHKREQYLSIIGQNSKVDQLAFSLSLQETSEPLEFEGGYAMIRLLDRKNISQEDFEKEKEKEIENLLEMKKNRFFHSYMIKLREEIGFNIKSDLFFKTISDVLSMYGGQN
ncbi:MAG: SurA N-terminal domain-containing protein [Candidatus Aminicenantes bacterium]|nr:SurA N-terminal domain-containing protein [Candidatus Aminicenantes bacterium]